MKVLKGKTKSFEETEVFVREELQLVRTVVAVAGVGVPGNDRRDAGLMIRLESNGTFLDSFRGAGHGRTRLDVRGVGGTEASGRDGRILGRGVVTSVAEGSASATSSEGTVLPPEGPWGTVVASSSSWTRKRINSRA